MARRSQVIDRDHGWAKATRRLMSLEDAEVTVGVHEDAGADLATIAAVHEFGSADGDIPERSFLRSTADEGRRRYAEQLSRAAGRMVDGQAQPAAIRAVGEAMAEDVRRKIAAGIDPPNDPETAERKGHSRTLIDTGALLDAITAKVEG